MSGNAMTEGRSPANLFKAGMRHLAASVNIISTMEDGEPRGMLATAVCSVCAEPPTLLVCINRNTSVYKAVHDQRRFCVSVLDERQFSVASEFLSLNGADRFKLCAWDVLETGAPAIRDALVNFDCNVVSEVEVGTHTTFFGRVVAARVAEQGKPLLYHDGNYSALRPEPLSQRL